MSWRYGFDWYQNHWNRFSGLPVINIGHISGRFKSLCGGASPAAALKVRCVPASGATRGVSWPLRNIWKDPLWLWRDRSGFLRGPLCHSRGPLWLWRGLLLPWRGRSCLGGARSSFGGTCSGFRGARSGFAGPALALVGPALALKGPLWLWRGPLWLFRDLLWVWRGPLPELWPLRMKSWLRHWFQRPSTSYSRWI